VICFPSLRSPGSGIRFGCEREAGTCVVESFAIHDESVAYCGARGCSHVIARCSGVCMGQNLTWPKLAPIQLDDAREICGPNTFRDEEIQQLYYRYQTACGRQYKAIPPVRFKAYILENGLFPNAPKNEHFAFFFRAVAEGNAEIEWKSFLRYNLAVKFGMPREAAPAQPANQAESSRVVDVDRNRPKERRQLLAVCYYHMLLEETLSSGCVTLLSVKSVVANVLKWSSPTDAPVNPAAVATVAANVFHALQIPDAATARLTKDEFIAKFCAHDEGARLLMSIL
jgi:hypothetical protein